MFDKSFLKESPVIWAFVGIVISLIFLVVSLLQIEWIQSGIIVLLIAWMVTCAKKDYTIWKLTKEATK